MPAQAPAMTARCRTRSVNSTRSFGQHSCPSLSPSAARSHWRSAMGIGRFAYTPILPEMVAALHLSASEAGLIASANFAGYLIGALVAAAVVLRAAPARLDAGRAAGERADDRRDGAGDRRSSLFVLLRFLGGFASAFVLVFTSSLVLDRLSETGRGHLVRHQFAGVGAGIAISAILVAQLAAHQSRGSGNGWRTRRCRCWPSRPWRSSSRPAAHSADIGRRQQWRHSAAARGADRRPTACSASATSSPRRSWSSWCAPTRRSCRSSPMSG